MNFSGTDTNLGLNWCHVGAFLGLTFGLTWLLDLALYLRDPIWHGKGGSLAPAAQAATLEAGRPQFQAVEIIRGG